ncbi:MAG: hypothetical protein KGJ94_08145 [Xanthomonadaceae bacterium]|nr:hypothetical protein [Xanthomonadaceae bacterium]
MRRLLASAMFTGLALALPLCAFGQVAAMPVIPAVKAVPAHAGDGVPLWKGRRTALTVTAGGRTSAAAPTGASVLASGQARSAAAGLRLVTAPGISAHLNVNEIRWTPVSPACAPGSIGCNGIVPVAGVQRGEVGAGYAGHGVKLDLSIGQAESAGSASPVRGRPAALPRVLPAEGGADVAAPLWFRNSTSTSLNARGQVNLAPGTSLDLGASIGRVRLLPGSGAGSDDTIDQTTLSFGIEHGAMRGAIVGHVLEPSLPGATLDQAQSWSGIDLGISVRLPWRGELNFGAQNVWTSGRAPLLFGSGAATPDQGRVPYVQYHQDL